MNQTVDDWTGRFAGMAQEQDQLDALRAENERLVRQRDDWLTRYIDAAAGWQQEQAENERLRAALEGVLAESDRKTAAFERAHAALGNDKARNV